MPISRVSRALNFKVSLHHHAFVAECTLSKFDALYESSSVDKTFSLQFLVRLAADENLVACTVTEKAAAAAAAAQPELAELPGRLLEYLSWSQADGGGADQPFQPAIAQTQPGEEAQRGGRQACARARLVPLLQLPQPGAAPAIILPAMAGVVTGAVLAAQHAWEPDNVIFETVHANPKFHGAPYFDCVSVMRERAPDSPGRDEPHWFAELRVLFSIKWGLEIKQLAMVRWFKAAAATTVMDRLAVRFGSRKLQWASRQRRGCQHPFYTIIPLDSIVKRECIVPDFRESSRGEFYFLNPFLWARNAA